MSEPLAMEGMVAFLGAGRMAQALARGFVSGGLVPADQIVAFDPSADARSAFQEAVGDSVRFADDVGGLARAEVVFVAVKPGLVDAAVGPLAADWRVGEQLLVSVAAGVSIAQLADSLPAGAAVVRVMPNTPCLVGRGACAFALGPHASDAQGELVERLLASVGVARRTEESLLDAVTGVSGSGPAFVYTVIEALADGGVRAGLPRALSAELAAATVAGAAEMVVQTGQHPAQLRDAVASPGGTTIAGLVAAEKHGLRAALIAAVEAAAQRSAELGG